MRMQRGLGAQCHVQELSSSRIAPAAKPWDWAIAIADPDSNISTRISSSRKRTQLLKHEDKVGEMVVTWVFV